MTSNVGKKFEEDFKKSVPIYSLLCRLPDSAQSFGGGSNLRFSAKSPFDFIMWDSKRHTLYALELKTVKENSITFERTKDDNGNIHFHQICGLKKWDEYDGIICGFIIEFRKLETTCFIDIKNFEKLMDLIPKKSFTFDDLRKYDVDYFLIPQKKVRTRYRYDLDLFLSNIEQKKDKDLNIHGG